MKRSSDYRKLVINFDSSMEITRAFEKEIHKILLTERMLESTCSFYFIKKDKTIKVGDFDYPTTETSVSDLKKLTKDDLDKISLYYAFLKGLKNKIKTYKRNNNLPDSIWDEFLENRIKLLNDFLNRGERERTL